MKMGNEKKSTQQTKIATRQWMKMYVFSTWNVDGWQNVRRLEQVSKKSSTIFALVNLVYGTLLGSKLISELCIFTILGDVFAPMHILYT